MHLAEDRADELLGRRRMGQRRPIGAGYLALLSRLAPQGAHLLLRLGLVELMDRQAVALIEGLVQQLGGAVVAAAETDAVAVQLVI